ncbi:MAG: glycosyltransferase family 2 protein [Chitinophagales bacterium]|nr:glycosyltransferase [Bacteroidota bacterium]MCB9043717.1 glycosyltransferase [Chitinophagales bacterium]
MAEFPLISIITVCYNAEKNIECTLQSVAEQQYAAIEYIVIDGASTDNTLQIIAKYRTNIHTLVSEQDRGIYHAMNKGLGKANGTFVWFLNAGDAIFAPDTLQKIFADPKAQQADFIYGNAQMYNPANGTTRLWYKTPPPDDEMSWKSFINGMVVCHQAMLMRRNIATVYKLRYHISADLDWTIRCLQQAQHFYQYHDIMCSYEEGGFSAQKRYASWKERYTILQTHFGTKATLAQHWQILKGAWQRKSWK